MNNILDSIENDIIIVNKKGKIVYCNKYLLDKLNYKLSELKGKYINSLFGENKDKFEDFGKLINNEDFIFELICKQKFKIRFKGKILLNEYNNGEHFYIVAKVHKNDSDNDVKNKLISILYNSLSEVIYKNRKLEDELNRILSTSNDLITIMDCNGNFSKTSTNWEECLGWSKDELINVKCQDLLDSDELEQVLEKIHAAKIHGHLVNSVNRYKCKNGEYKVFNWRCIYVKERNIYIGSGTDITEETRLEKERKRYEEAFTLENVKNEFFANMSHEFKTPLNVILSAIQLIDYGIKNNYVTSTSNIKLENCTNSIKHNSYRLLRLVNNIMDITKIDTGHYEINLENLNIVSFIEDIITSVNEYVENKRINIVFDTKIEEFIVACDPEKIERILLNLISNAIKYSTTNGRIEINIKVDDYVIISVKDNGIGIKEEYAEIIFERFKQIDNTFTKKAEGSGIGLSIVKSLVELHGGKVWVNTAYKNGAEFIFTIPKVFVNKNQNKDLHNSIISQNEKFNIEFSDIYDL